MQNTYRLAGHAIEIKSIYKEVHMLCAPYLVDDEADITFQLRLPTLI